MDLKTLQRELASFLNTSQDNIIPELGGIKIYGSPIFAAASADDPLFLKLKEPDVVGEIHRTPREWFKGAVSVVSYFLPFSEEIRVSNRYEKVIVSEEWLYGRVEGEALNNEVRRFVSRSIGRAGSKALAPVLNPAFRWVGSTSNWSERHVAYIAGLGTFGLHKSIITEKGCAGRFGSVITDLKLMPTRRNYGEIFEYCTMCEACGERCPGDAVSSTGKDHSLCFDYLGKTMKNYAPRIGCGKCITSVPCESQIPEKLIIKKTG